MQRLITINSAWSCNLNHYVDINECLIDNGGCEFSCTNLEGIGGLPDVSGSGSNLDSAGTGNATSQTSLGYQCGCDTGYHLAPNDHDCIGKNVATAIYA